MNEPATLDQRIAALSPDIDPAIHAELQGVYRTLRQANFPTGVLGLMSRLCLTLFRKVYADAGQKWPSDNLYDVVSRAADGDPPRDIPGLRIVPAALVSAFHTLRMFANRVNHAIDGGRFGGEEAELTLNAYLIVLKWYYCEFPDRSVKLSTIYRRESDGERPGAGQQRPRLRNHLPADNRASFVGREALLGQIHQALAGDGSAGPVALAQAVHGLGGVGKTQLAIRYVYDHAADYDAVFWLTADPPSKLAADYAALAKEIGLPAATQTTDLNEQIAAVRHWLESAASGHWLLVFDNADEPDTLRDYLPTGGGGHVLLTSRRSRFRKGIRPLEVHVMERSESVRLLLERSGQSDAAAADRLAAELGDLPLALAQAGGYLEETQMPLADYLQLFQTRRGELLQRGDPPDGYGGTLFATLGLAMQRINKPAAEELLGLIACLAPDDIPRSLLARAFDDPIRFNDALTPLVRHSLIRAEGEIVEAHRLVQAVARERMSAEVKVLRVGRAIQLLEAAFPQESYETETWEECRPLQPHADHASGLADQCQVAAEQTARLLDRLALFEEYRARLAAADAFGRRALALKENTFGPDHPEVARTLGNLGNVARKQGDLSGARQLLERALRIKEQSYGPGHPEVARTLDNLGNVAREQGDLSGARQLLERALRIEEQSYGPDHPEVARTLGNLGNVAQDQGDLSGARQLQERALRIFEQSYGPDHPEVARTLTNLGNVAQDQGDLSAARQLQERALRIQEQSYGPDHPEVAITLHNLGYVLVKMGERVQGKLLVERALATYRKFLGEEHPHTARARNLLARIERELPA